jgi:hypothetical protein
VLKRWSSRSLARMELLSWPQQQSVSGLVGAAQQRLLAPYNSVVNHRSAGFGAKPDDCSGGSDLECCSSSKKLEVQPSVFAVRGAQDECSCQSSAFVVLCSWHLADAVTELPLENPGGLLALSAGGVRCCSSWCLGSHILHHQHQ